MIEDNSSYRFIYNNKSSIKTVGTTLGADSGDEIHNLKSESNNKKQNKKEFRLMKVDKYLQNKLLAKNSQESEF